MRSVLNLCIGDLVVRSVERFRRLPLLLRYRETEAQRYRKTQAPRYRAREIPTYKDTEIPRYRDPEIQGCHFKLRV